MRGTALNWWAWVETVLVVILGTPVVALIWLFTAPFDKGRYAAGRAFRLVGVTAMRLNGLWRFRTRGTLADPRRPYVVVANHESYADVFLISCFPWEMKWLSKDTMFKIPCMGWMMQMAGDIKLVRGDRDSTINAIAQCRDRLAKRVSVMIFPEGTRSKTQEMLPFKDGAFRLAIESQAPVLPIAVAGTRNAMAKGTFRFLRAHAVAQVLEPIDTAGMTMDDIGRLKQMARERIDAGRRALAAELGIAMPPVATEATAAV
ncbi:lysophospholipid acyltransferase family protein [Gemmatimonas sp.]|uniref:lysophospholipid acyltransferase family protein n=1 Tax=Gemmatimonas sp. TaxID=1962908 RepID=UPI0022BD71E7|nr:lysophospholipid acyltransferase family protein [Gemmatimonas sp.]MCZ8203903.1 lysophospholipid acyltransferase family protein [Gemmatimonas sp.]